MTYNDFTQRFEFDPNANQLGEGGFGRVYKAWDNTRREDVALKIAPVPPGMEELSLLQEFERVRHLMHGNIAIYLDCHRLDFPMMGRHDVAYMKYYQTGHLGQLLDQQQLSPSQKEHVLLGILSGIEYLHSRQPFIIHRDLKPANILIVPRAGQYHPLITDFGISRSGATDAGKSYVSNTLKAFSLNFAAPEQADGDELRRNADLWSFGVIVAYVWLDGRLPFRTEGLDLTTDTGQQRLRQRIRDLDLVAQVGGLPEPWRTVVRRCLVLDPKARLASCQEARQLLTPAVPGLASTGESTRLLAPSLTPAQDQPPAPAPALLRPAPPAAAAPPRPGPAGAGPTPQARQAWYAAGLVLLLTFLGGGWAYKHRDTPPDPQNEKVRPLLPTAADSGRTEAAAPAGSSLLPTAADSGRTEAAAPAGSSLLPTAADSGRTEAAAPAGSSLLHRMVELGDSLSNGEGGVLDKAKARAWYRKAADAGDADGMIRLGNLYRNAWDVKQDYAQARAWYRKAADAGSTAGMYYLGSMYGRGQGVKQDYAQARAWFQKAADAGDTDSMLNLGSIYSDGHGVKQDYAQACAWYRKAADAGDVDGMDYLGLIYSIGQGVKQDDALARAWFQKAADAGSASAKKHLQELTVK